MKIINRRTLKGSKLEPILCKKAVKYRYVFLFRTIIICGGAISDKTGISEECKTCGAYRKNINLDKYSKESGIYLYSIRA